MPERGSVFNWSAGSGWGNLLNGDWVVSRGGVVSRMVIGVLGQDGTVFWMVIAYMASVFSLIGPEKMPSVGNTSIRRKKKKKKSLFAAITFLSLVLFT